MCALVFKQMKLDSYHWSGDGGIGGAVLMPLQHFRGEREELVAWLRLLADQRYEEDQDHDDHGANDSGHDARVVLKDVGYLVDIKLIFRSCNQIQIFHLFQ